MAETVTKRLHIGGLTPNITPAHLRDRFKIFGQVDEVEQLHPDPLGQARPFAYLTMQITPQQLTRCMNTLSGSMYRGTQLRIAEARPRYTEKLKNELSPPAEKVEKAAVNKRKRARREMGPEVGKEAQDMGLVTEENHTRSKFWKVTETHHLVRPLALRPTHTLPPPVIQISKPEAPASSDKPVKRNPPNRQRRRVINPLLWAPTHLTESTLSTEPVECPAAEEWVFEEADAEDADLSEQAEVENGEEDKVVLGRWRKVGGTEAEAQIVRVKRRRVVAGSEAGEDEGDDLDFDWGVTNRERADSPLFGNREVSPLFASRGGEERAESPLFGDRIGGEEIGDGTRSEKSDSPLFASREKLAVSESASAEASEVGEVAEVEGDISSAADEEESPLEASPAPSSPLFSARPTTLPTPSITTVDPTPIIAAPSTSVPKPTTSVPASKPTIPTALVHQAKSETSLGLSVLSSLLAETPNAQYIPTRPGRDEWKGFAESDSEGEDDIFLGRNVVSEGVLRLRGGAGDEDEDMESGDDDEEDSSNSDSDSDSDSTSEPSSSGSSISSSSSPSSSSSSSPSSSSSSNYPSPNRPANPTKTLRNLFSARPAPTTTSSTSASGGFSLAALAGDIEMTDELDIPLAAHPSQPSKPELELLAHVPKQTFDASPDIPLFFLPSSSGTKPEVARPGWAKHAITVQKEKAAEREARAAAVGNAYNVVVSQAGGDEGEVDNVGTFGFWRKETDEDMTERWNRVRGELTTEWKRKGREARKQRKRRGGGGDDE